jgi:hypothetical protein
VKLSGRAWLFIVAAVVAGGAVWLAIDQRARAFAASPAGMLERLPAQNAMILFVDFDALRKGGLLHLLSTSRVTEEPDYQTFVRSSGFDYGRDLDRAAVSFGSDGEFFVVKGRFDWDKLESYARDQGGLCLKSLCRMPGSTPERRISFYPLQSDLMALAVSTDGYAASRLADSHSGAVQPLELPSDPVWLSIPADSLKGAERFPTSTRLFASALASADKILVSLGPQGQQLEARLAVTCRTSEDAAALLIGLERATSLLRDSLARENQKPNPKDLSGVLTAGIFEQSGRRVSGRWPLGSEFLKSLAGATM